MAWRVWHSATEPTEHKFIFQWKLFPFIVETNNSGWCPRSCPPSCLFWGCHKCGANVHVNIPGDSLKKFISAKWLKFSFQICSSSYNEKFRFFFCWKWRINIWNQEKRIKNWKCKKCVYLSWEFYQFFVFLSKMRLQNGEEFSRVNKRKAISAFHHCLWFVFRFEGSAMRSAVETKTPTAKRPQSHPRKICFDFSIHS